MLCKPHQDRNSLGRHHVSYLQSCKSFLPSLPARTLAHICICIYKDALQAQITLIDLALTLLSVLQDDELMLDDLPLLSLARLKILLLARVPT